MSSGPPSRARSEADTPGGEQAAVRKTGRSTTTAAEDGGTMRVALPASCLPPRTAFPARHLVWIVFGGTGHMGRSLVKSALAHGDDVVAVGRTGETAAEAMAALAQAAEAAAAAALASRQYAGPNESNESDKSDKSNGPKDRRPGRCVGALCDVRLRASVEAVVRYAVAEFGRVDVVANCSGYGVVGACEDQDDFDLRNQYETNFMGTLHILQATLPVFRRQSKRVPADDDDADDADDDDVDDDADDDSGPTGGRYLIFSSTSGALGVPGQGPYCATKYAVEGLVEAMLYEVDAFDIKATLVEPGLVRRDDAGLTHRRNADATDATDVADAADAADAADVADVADATGRVPTWGHFLIKPPSAPYAAATSPALHTTRIVQWLGDRQPTSVVQCAEIVWQLAHCAFPPLRLPLGSYAIESIRDRLRSVTEETADWKHLNFAPVPDDGANANADADADVNADADTARAEAVAVADRRSRPWQPGDPETVYAPA